MGWTTSEGPERRVLVARILPRVSDEGNRGEKLTSVKTQIREGIRVLNALRTTDGTSIEVDVEASELYCDLDQSGFVKHWTKRPGLMRHLRDAAEGKFQVIAFWKIDRIARRVRWSIEIVEEFQKHGVRVVGIEDNIDLDTPQGRFMFNIMSSCAEQEAENISSRVRSSKRFHREEGRRSGGKLPLWLRYEKGPEGNRVVDFPHGREMALRMVELRQAGRGYHAIAKDLNDAGYRNRKGGLWLQGDVHRFFSEKSLARMEGSAVHTEKDRYGKPTKRWEPVPNAHPPLLDPERMAALRAVLSVTSAAARGMAAVENRRHRYSVDSPNILSGILYCAECGGRCTSGQQRKSDDLIDPRYYVCSRARASRELHTKTAMLGAGQAESAVLRVVKHVLVHPGVEAPSRTPKPSRRARRGRDEVLKDVEAVTGRWLAGALPQEVYDRFMARFSGELAGIEAAGTPPRESDPPADDRPQPLVPSLRGLVHAVVERVEGPVYLQDVLTSTNSRGRSSRRRPRRCLLVSVRLADRHGRSVFVAPLYPAGSRVPRELYSPDGRGGHVRVAIHDRPA